MPFQDRADGDANFQVVPMAFVERPLGAAQVPDPSRLAGVGFLPRCLHLSDFVVPLYDKMLEGGFFLDEDGEPFEYSDPDQFLSDARAAALALKDDAVARVDDTAWDHYEHNTHLGLAWVDDYVTLDKLTEITYDLSLYVELNMMVGPRALDADRVAPAAQLFIMCGTPVGGRLVEAITMHHLGEGAELLAPTMAAQKLPAYIHESAWEAPYDVAYSTFTDYAFDATRRAKWQTASESAWPLLVRDKFVRAVRRQQPLQTLLWSHEGRAPELMRESARIGNAMLEGAAGSKHPLRNLAEVNRRLARDHEPYIRASHAGGVATSLMIDHLSKHGSRDTPDAPAEKTGGEDDQLGAKRSEVKKALGDGSFVELELKWLPRLEEATGSERDSNAMYEECFTAATLLPKAVLLKGRAKISSYTCESKFLGLLHDEKEGLRHYFGQCLAFDEEEDEVPEGLETYQLSEKQADHFVKLEWEQMNVLEIELAMESKRSTSRFPEHDSRKLYRTPNGLALLSKVMGPLYKGAGMKDDVPKARGWSHPTFMRQLMKLYRASVGLEPTRAESMHVLIERFHKEGTRAAARAYGRTVYGSSPGGKSLGAWLAASEPIFTEIEGAVAAAKKINNFAVALPGVFGGEVQAPALPGLGASSSRAPTRATGEDGEERGPSRREKKRRRDKSPTKGARGKAPAGVEDDDDQDDDEAGDGRASGGKVTSYANMDKATRLKVNPKRVFYYEDGSHSMGAALINFPKICAKMKWDAKKLCGPVTMTMVSNKPRDYDCMDSSHRCDERPTPR